MQRWVNDPRPGREVIGNLAAFQAAYAGSSPVAQILKVEWNAPPQEVAMKRLRGRGPDHGVRLRTRHGREAGNGLCMRPTRNPDAGGRVGSALGVAGVARRAAEGEQGVERGRAFGGDSERVK